MEKQSLTPFAEEKLGYYVYALRNPIDGKIFYVGKGQGSRVLAHANGVIDDPNNDESLKNATIKQIHGQGLEVESYIIQHNLKDEEHAFASESAIYGMLKLLSDGLDHSQFGLTNKVAPPYFNDYGLRNIQRVLDDYGKPADCSKVPHNSLLIKVARSGTWRPGMSRQEVWESVRGWWHLNPSRLKNVRYIIAIPDFVIRGVWEVTPSDWREQGPSDRGWDDILRKRAKGKESSPRFGVDAGRDLSEDRFSELISTSIEEHFSRHAKQSNFYYLDDFRVRDLERKGERPFWNVSLT
jgi:hypothetical protein